MDNIFYLADRVFKLENTYKHTNNKTLKKAHKYALRRLRQAEVRLLTKAVK